MDDRVASDRQPDQDLQLPEWRGFVYFNQTERITAVGDRQGAVDAASASPPPVSAPAESGIPVPLAQMRVGDRVRIVSLDCGESSSRLMGMGFMPGVVLEVISRTATGSVIVALQDHRLGLGVEMARRIQVVEATTPSGTDQTTHTAIHTATMATMQSNPQISTVKLGNAAIGSRLRVIGYEPTARDYKRKLLAMGLTPGTELRVTRHAPLGDPTEIEVRDFHLSLRKDEADALIVQPV